jgi:hypothetical protein
MSAPTLTTLPRMRGREGEGVRLPPARMLRRG